MRKNSIHIRVNWGDTDKAGIVYYPNFFKWFDIAGHQFFRDCDISPAYLESEHNIILPILEANCNFENPLLYDDIITIHTEVEEINRKTLKLKHEIEREDHRMGSGYELRGWVQQTGDNIKAVQIPEDITNLLKENKHTTDEGEKPRLYA